MVVIKKPEIVKKIGTPYHIYGISTGEKWASSVINTASVRRESSSGKWGSCDFFGGAAGGVATGGVAAVGVAAVGVAAVDVTAVGKELMFLVSVLQGHVCRSSTICGQIAGSYP